MQPANSESMDNKNFDEIDYTVDVPDESENSNFNSNVSSISATKGLISKFPNTISLKNNEPLLEFIEEKSEKLDLNKNGNQNENKIINRNEHDNEHKHEYVPSYVLSPSDSNSNVNSNFNSILSHSNKHNNLEYNSPFNFKANNCLNKLTGNTMQNYQRKSQDIIHFHDFQEHLKASYADNMQYPNNIQYGSSTQYPKLIKIWKEDKFRKNENHPKLDTRNSRFGKFTNQNNIPKDQNNLKNSVIEQSPRLDITKKVKEAQISNISECIDSLLTRIAEKIKIKKNIEMDRKKMLEEIKNDKQKYDLINVLSTKKTKVNEEIKQKNVNLNDNISKEENFIYCLNENAKNNFNKIEARISEMNQTLDILNEKLIREKDELYEEQLIIKHRKMEIFEKVKELESEQIFLLNSIDSLIKTTKCIDENRDQKILLLKEKSQIINELINSDKISSTKTTISKKLQRIIFSPESPKLKSN